MTAINCDTILDGLLYKPLEIGAGNLDGFDVFLPAVEHPQKPKSEAYASYVLGYTEGFRKLDTYRRVFSALGVGRLSEQKLGSGVECLRPVSRILWGISSVTTYSVEKQWEQVHGRPVAGDPIDELGNVALI